VNKDLYNY